jgi:hypothetical protein
MTQANDIWIITNIKDYEWNLDITFYNLEFTDNDFNLEFTDKDFLI